MNRERRYVIVGNGFAGTTCAEHLRKLDGACEITMFADEPYTLYNRISLPPLLRKQIPEAKIFIRDLAWHEKQRIDLRLRTRVERVSPEEHCVYAEGRAHPYDALLIATGGRPNPTTVPGAEGAHNLFNFQYLDDTRAISEQIDSSKSAVAIGGSFIAYELAEAFAARGLEAHWLMRGPHFLRRSLDEVAGEMVDQAACADGVKVHYEEEVREFVRSNGVITKVITKSGLEIAGDCFGVGLGLTMNTELISGTSIDNHDDGIVCDDRLETAVPGIFAAGDVAKFYDPIAEMSYRMGTWNNAGAQGKVVAINMTGGDQRYHDVPEYSSKLFTGQMITQFGLNPDYRSDLDAVHKIDHELQHYRALYFHHGRLVGGVLLGKGNRSGKRKYVEAIKTKQHFESNQWASLLDWTA
ncbi:MAG TPA: NAD(P)/FAD-dependent oxidoreductase [Candidatus Baltobacteraceae bacterium]|jgi:NAD(P)H-nitrite reductase large subunit|nr:NAD(P)/FAD-dependent oxidoreductase [Candidatus Baltobacteraceae bacterium]